MVKLKNGLVALLDIGSNKVVCFIAKLNPQSGPEIIGIGHQVSQGIRGSVVTDIKNAESSILAALSDAEKMAGETVENIIVNISGNTLKSDLHQVEVHISGNEISNKDINRVLALGYGKFDDDKREVVHCIPIDYSIDGTSGIKDPLGMYGKVLSAKIHLISVSSNVMLNLTNCLARCQLNVEDYIATPYASGIACLSEDEKRLGVTLIDIGGHTTSIALFKNGKMVFTDTLPLGGQHVTSDIACGLSTSLTHAERIKILHGNAIATSADERELLEVQIVGEDEMQTIKRSQLISIIRPRLEEILEMVIEILKNKELDEYINNRVVLTGGASQLSGLKELSSHIFGKQIRIASPKTVSGIAENTKGPAFSTAIGMLLLEQEKGSFIQFENEVQSKISLKNFLPKAVNWVKENF